MADLGQKRKGSHRADIVRFAAISRHPGEVSAACSVIMDNDADAAQYSGWETAPIGRAPQERAGAVAPPYKCRACRIT
jgi:hypothetical protein